MALKLSFRLTVVIPKTEFCPRVPNMFFEEAIILLQISHLIPSGIYIVGASICLTEGTGTEAHSYHEA